MAKAPTPGKTKAADAARLALRIRVRDQTLFAPTPKALPLREKFAVRAATGMPIEEFVQDGRTLGEDAIAVLWWLARRAAGETALTFAQAEADWPTDLVGDDVAVDLVDMAQVSEDEHPES